MSLGNALNRLPAWTPLQGKPLKKQNERSGTAVRSFSSCFTTDSMDIPKNTNRFPALDGRTKRINRVNGYAHRSIVNASPNLLQRMFTGQLPPHYFNEVCYGRKPTPREYLFRTPTKDREKELWEPKKVSREKARHVVRDIQDAWFRRQSLYEKESLKKSKVQMKKTEAALMKESDIMSRGRQAYLLQLDKQKQKLPKLKKRKGKIVADKEQG